MKSTGSIIKYTLALAAIAGILVSFQNCGGAHFGNMTNGSVEGGNGGGGEPPICISPSPGTSNSENGIATSITYIPSTSSVVAGSGGSLTTASFAPGKPDVQVISNPAYLNQFVAYDQSFTLGFQLKTGEYVKDLGGNKLDEYFSLRNESLLGLAQTSSDGSVTAGNYQLAVISDDGAILNSADSNGNYSTLVNNDGTHSSKMACATRTINLQAGQRIPIKLDYYQGPRTRIALMVMWRLNPNNLNDTSLCGTTSNFAEGSSNFNTLAAKGWQMVPAGNFYLPGGERNPCSL